MLKLPASSNSMQYEYDRPTILLCYYYLFIHFRYPWWQRSHTNTCIAYMHNFFNITSAKEVMHVIFSVHLSVVFSKIKQKNLQADLA